MLVSWVLREGRCCWWGSVAAQPGQDGSPLRPHLHKTRPVLPPSLDARDAGGNAGPEREGGSRNSVEKVGVAKWVEVGPLALGRVISFQQGRPDVLMRQPFLARRGPALDPREVAGPPAIQLAL